MTLEISDSGLEYSLPTEIWLYIFSYLPGKQLVRLRQVCSRWRNMIDGLIRNDTFWLGHCKRDYGNVYRIASYKARMGTMWFNLYRSLTLWPQLLQAKEIRDEFASASSIPEEILGFVVLGDGIIAIHKVDRVVYYDIETLEPFDRPPITGNYAHHFENQQLVLIKSFHYHLFVTRKRVYDLREKSHTTFDNVKLNLLLDEEVYYVDTNNNIYVCRIADNLQGTFLKHSDENIMCLGYTDRLHYLTYQRKIYTLTNGSAVLSSNLDEHPNLFDQLYKYNLLETVDWSMVLHWLYVLRRKVPEGPMREILTVKVYGNVFLVGCNWGVFRIYYAPFINGEFDLYNSEPIKQYNFMERFDCPVLTMCPVIKVDAMEAKDGHTILVAMPKKIVILDFVHTFKRTASVAMLPYSEVQKVKLLKMENGSV